jgi:hypothetical protein
MKEHLTNELFGEENQAESIFDKKEKTAAPAKPKQMKVPPRAQHNINEISEETQTQEKPTSENLKEECTPSNNTNGNNNVSFSEENCQSVYMSENKSSKLESTHSKENDLYKY